jgi:hypothetical protein
MRCTAGPLQSSRSVPVSASTQCAEADRRGCGTEVPDPSTVSLIESVSFQGESKGYQTERRKAKEKP